MVLVNFNNPATYAAFVKLPIKMLKSPWKPFKHNCSCNATCFAVSFMQFIFILVTIFILYYGNEVDCNILISWIFN